ncbi:hypothetical protein AMATHDRAFT_73234 [Amanita thiersii Skay4041]|uniref:Peroxin-5 n=1 Tax=Amanita thiersii Skay4041 TaxID=703135 RepID=A0A2A9P0E2_9AGAR|nr:hypothetical protein AMATHDRAFT_73234 [Amanita thiersii Skay4041]
MALPMLVGGAECGPSNPLQTLSKRFDQDRGAQQDHFGISHAGPSKEAFRRQTVVSSLPGQEASQFFSSAAYSAPYIAPPAPFDLSSLHDALPTPQLQMPVHVPQGAASAWAADFAQAMQNPEPNFGEMKHPHPLQHEVPAVSLTQPAVGPGFMSQDRLRWNPVMPMHGLNPMQAYISQPTMHMQNHAQHVVDQTSWDKEFISQELNMIDSVHAQEIKVDVAEPLAHEPADELARTAALLLEQVKHEQNPKFLNSQFMDLMRQLRDGKVVVEGNQMVESDGTSVYTADVKGKGRAVDNTTLGQPNTTLSSGQTRVLPTNATVLGNQGMLSQEDANDAYFRQENEDYMQYWNGSVTHPPPAGRSLNEAEWDTLQRDWERFEATTAGIRPVNAYRFQANNPYILGDSSRLATERQSVMESVLELEAAVQNNMNNARTWYQLGVKQQENEREQKALQALERSVELEPGHLPSWLALAISYTNDNNRAGAYDSIFEWVNRNEKYKLAVQPMFPKLVAEPNLSLAQRYDHLINCLITMARSNNSGEIDADIQIALAVLLNSNEEYGKAQDCFKTALAVRPDDWLLYNRVGATMANNGRAEEALQYYYKALELNPGYIRARFNLGISCINLRRYEEAAQHILDALVLQETDGTQDPRGLSETRGVTTSTLWDSLKTTCLHLQRIDLATLCDRKDLEGMETSEV